jgi:hypothetical protein
MAFGKSYGLCQAYRAYDGNKPSRGQTIRKNEGTQLVHIYVTISWVKILWGPGERFFISFTVGHRTINGYSLQSTSGCSRGRRVSNPTPDRAVVDHVAFRNFDKKTVAGLACANYFDGGLSTSINLHT